MMPQIEKRTRRASRGGNCVSILKNSDVPIPAFRKQAMKQVATALIATTCFVFLSWQPSQAQQPKAVQVQITNLTGMDISVQGHTIVNGQPQRGNLLPIKKKVGVAFEKVHAGTTRIYTIYDPLRQQVILLQNPSVNVPNRDIVLKIMPSPTNPKMLVIVPAD
jgi:hypothetical protein